MNPELLPGTLAETVADVEPPPPAALKLVSTGRMSPSAQTWRSPLPPALADRLPKALRQGHERLVRRWEEASAEARTAKLAADQAHEADREATRSAISKGKKPAAAGGPAATERAAEAERVRDVHAQMVLESGTTLVQALTDADLDAVVTTAKDEAHAIIEEELPAQIEQALATLARAGELTGQATWVAVLADKRRQLPWTGARQTPASSTLAATREGLERALEMVRVELEARHRRAHPPQHHPPTLAVPTDQWPEPDHAA